MIENIVIKNALVFSDVNLELKSGLNVFSGVSGSGKSVFMQALLAAFGLRDSNAEFQSTSLSPLPLCVDEFGLEYDREESIILNIQKKDKTRFFFNSNPISKKTLSSLLSPFVKHISLKNASELEMQNIIHILDLSIGGEHLEILEKFRTKFLELKSVENEILRLLEQEQKINELREFALFEIQKIESINPKIGEYEELLDLKKNLSKKEKLMNILADALECFETLKPIHQAIDMLEIQNNLENELLETKMILENELEKLQNLSEMDPERILDRISSLSDLNQRYGSLENALSRLQEQKIKLQEYNHLHEDKSLLQNKQKQLQQECQALAQTLHEKRLRQQKTFEEKIYNLCQLLKLKDPALLLNTTDALTENGYTNLNLHLSGTTISNLSTGEYNRLRLIMMCLESEFSQKVGILILDEIDANLSGEESDGVAQVLKKLSTSYQIFAISHQPHIPAVADAHYLVSKDSQGSWITLLDNEGKIQEIARMVSGTQITKEAIEFAKIRLGL